MKTGEKTGDKVCPFCDKLYKGFASACKMCLNRMTGHKKKPDVPSEFDYYQSSYGKQMIFFQGTWQLYSDIIARKPIVSDDTPPTEPTRLSALEW